MTRNAANFPRLLRPPRPMKSVCWGVCGQFPPGADVFPEEVHGLPFVAFLAAYAGPADEGERILEPLRTFREPLVDFSGVMPYLEVQQFFDEDYPDGMRYYWKSLNLPGLSDAAIEKIAEYALAQPSPPNDR